MPSEVFEEDDIGRTSLFHAAATGNMEEVKRLIFSCSGTGMSCQRLHLIGHKDHLGLTAIDAAKNSGHDDVAQLLAGELGRMEYFE